MTSETRSFRMPRSWLWGVAYWTVLAAMVADANLGLLQDPWHWMLKVLVLILVIPLLISGHRQAREEGPVSSALTACNLRMGVAAGACILVFSVAANIYHRVPLDTPALWLLGLVTAMPVLTMIWIMGWYLAEETDEYLRHLATMSALIGLAAVLVLATVWGFLNDLGLVPHVSTWWLVPFFAVANGIGRAFLKASAR